jgi:hypothetical protein
LTHPLIRSPLSIMDYAKELEKKLAAQIRCLQKIRQLETEKKDAIEKEDLDSAENLQIRTDALIKEAQVMADAINEINSAIESKHGPWVSEKIAALHKAAKQLADEAAVLTKGNRHRLREQLQSVFSRLEHVRTGKTAIAGYKESIGQNISDKGPNRGEK